MPARCHVVAGSTEVAQPRAEAWAPVIDDHDRVRSPSGEDLEDLRKVEQRRPHSINAVAALQDVNLVGQHWILPLAHSYYRP
jgi:hypothetical protein